MPDQLGGAAGLLMFSGIWPPSSTW
jgi:hypothetical protein